MALLCKYLLFVRVHLRPGKKGNETNMTCRLNFWVLDLVVKNRPPLSEGGGKKKGVSNFVERALLAAFLWASADCGSTRDWASKPQLTIARSIEARCLKKKIAQ